MICLQGQPSCIRRFRRSRLATLASVAAWAGLATLAAFVPTACPEPSAPGPGPGPGCVPDCAGRECGPDGCGGACGACGDLLACGPLGQCVEPEVDPPGCTETCGEAGFECGEVCGVSCGTCIDPETACVDGQCLCSPVCAAQLCEQPDGCGQLCGPCARAESCADCVIRLEVIEAVAVDDQTREVTVALDYAPGPAAALPTTADLRFEVRGPAQLLAVGLAPAVLDANKTLATDPDTGKPFRVLDEDVHQVLLLSATNTTPIAAGRWLLLRFQLGPESAADAAGWTAEPAVIRMVQREETFAPPPADTALWAGGYTDPVVVWADQGGAP